MSSVFYFSLIKPLELNSAKMDEVACFKIANDHFVRKIDILNATKPSEKNNTGVGHKFCIRDELLLSLT